METSPEKLISVIIPIYNTENYIKRCIDSILENSYQNIEILCVNDGSTDGSANILNQYADHPKIRIINQKNQGVSAARNMALNLAKGEYISFIDSDDYVHPRYFETLMRLIDQGADIAVCQEQTVNDAFTMERQLPSPEKISQYNSDSAVNESFIKRHVWGRIYKASILKNVRFFEGVPLSEDSAFNICVFVENPRLLVIASSKPLYYYYMRSQSAVHTLPPSTIIMRGEYFLKIVHHIPDSRGKWLCLEEIFKSILAYRYFYSFASPSEKKKAFSHCKEMIHQCFLIMRDLPLRPKLRFRYSIMAKFPSIYRLYRIVTDPTMLQWEKNQKSALKNRNVD